MTDTMAGDMGNRDAPANEPDAMHTEKPEKIYKHKIATRLWHWVNAITIFIMLGTGLTILNAHPHLYWGQYGANSDPAWFHVSQVFANGHIPGWLTIPSTYNLALARRWHLTFALIFGFSLLIFMITSLINRHFLRDMRIRLKELGGRHLVHDIKEHLAFRFHDPANPRALNVLQKISYVVVIFGLIPMIIFTGICMSPGLTAAWPWLLDITGGRASARSLHFIAAMGISGFLIVHLVLVILAGPINEVRSMITGWWKIPEGER